MNPLRLSHQDLLDFKEKVEQELNKDSEKLSLIDE